MTKYLGLISMIGAGATFYRLFLMADGYTLREKTISKLVFHERIARKAYWAIILFATLRIIYFGYLILAFDLFFENIYAFWIGVIVIVGAIFTAIIPVSVSRLMHRLPAFSALGGIILFSFIFHFQFLNYSNSFEQSLGYSIPILLAIAPLYWGVIKHSWGYAELAIGILFTLWDLFLLVFFF